MIIVNKGLVVQKAQEYLNECQPNGYTLRLVADEIRQDGNWWEIPI